MDSTAPDAPRVRDSLRTQPALVSDNGVARIRNVAVPLLEENDVLVRVAVVGLCRTDLAVLDGRIATPGPIVAGHEFAGVVESVGSKASNLRVGRPVAVNPILPCGSCLACRQNRDHECSRFRMLGVDRDGCLTSLVKVDASQVFKVPDSLPLEAAAFAEPVAASLAVSKAGIHPGDCGLIAGDNRIAQLTRDLLAAMGFDDVRCVAAEHLKESDANAFDFVIETQATTSVLEQLLRLVRPGGVIVLKSRQLKPVALNVNELLRKEPVIRPVRYGRFQDAVNLLAGGAIDVRRFIGERFAFEDWRAAIDAANADESRKTFVQLSDC